MLVFIEEDHLSTTRPDLTSSINDFEALWVEMRNDLKQLTRMTLCPLGELELECNWCKNKRYYEESGKHTCPDPITGNAAQRVQPIHLAPQPAPAPPLNPWQCINGEYSPQFIASKVADILEHDSEQARSNYPIKSLNGHYKAFSTNLVQNIKTTG